LAEPTGSSAKATAVFLDRDGTLIQDAGYIADPDQVRLVDGAAEAVRRLSRAGHLVVLVSNQSGIARGLFDEPALERVHARMEELLAAEGATLDGAYYCPYLDGPEATVAAYRRASDLRKPQPGMLLTAARELGIDLSNSWMIGDSAVDVEAGSRAGCRTILVERNGVAPSPPGVAPTRRVRSIMEAVELLETSLSSSASTPADRVSDVRGSVPGPREDESVRLLRDIRDQLERANRTGHQQDFSTLRLGGALLQMLAIVAGLWGVMALFEDQPAQATARLALACFLQLAAIAGFAIDRFR
jgi:D-glycero-D-manno-heptose 1,7-bisphosphate phosphatase